MIDAATIAEHYISTWNEKDAETRAALIERHWSDTPTYIDPLAAVSNVGDLSALIGGVHERFPGLEFSLVSTPDGHGGYLRFAWGLGPVGGEPIVEGSDVVETKDGRIHRVIGFLDKVPAM